MAGARLSEADRRLCQELVYGVVRWQPTLDWLVARKAQTPPPPRVQILLRLGLYQIFWLERIPNHAAVNETVELAKRAGFGRKAGFVNALLRGYLREFDGTRHLLEQLKSTDPALGYAHPGWLVKRWQARWGPGPTAQLMSWNNTPPPTFARVNTLKIDPGKLLEQWREEGLEYDFFRRDWLPEILAFQIKSAPGPFARLPSFQRGFFYVQDPSTLLAPVELGARPGESVLDLCAAPGGKLTCIAQLRGNQGRLVAHDPSPERLALVRENCARLGVTPVEILTSVAAPAAARLDQREAATGVANPSFDRILVDAPCSNTGVMRRRVEVRLRLRAEEIERLQSAQFDLLAQAAAWLKPGGTLVYSTCSLEPEENQQLVGRFAASHPAFQLKAERELTPFGDGVDGAYVARLVRSN